jgi:hypothetical protein
MLRKIFGSKREEVTGDWRKLHNEDLHDLCCLQNITRLMAVEDDVMGEACGTCRREEKCAKDCGGET